MKVPQTEPIECGDKCAEKNASETRNKLNEIQDLLKTHNTTGIHDER